MSDTLIAAAAGWRHLPPELAADAARQDQEGRWAQGDRPPAEASLAALPRVAASPDDALALIYGEVVLRAEAGETANPAEYALRFPQYADRLAAIFAVHQGLSFGAVHPAQPGLPFEPPPPPAVPGLSGLEYVGRGGVGLVYRATEEATGRPVAVKLVAESAATPDVLVRFLQEAEILRRLDHPHVVRLVGTGETRGRPYLVSEWVGGGTLAARIGGRPVQWEEAVRVLGALAAAVRCAHGQGIVHRDLKPSNVLLTDSGEPKVTDFGVARLLRAGGLMTATGHVVGTPAYMPPEQAEGRHRDVGPASDVYGLGAIFYEMLTGRPPFAGANRIEVLRRVLSETPESPADLVPGLPPLVAAVCLLCLEKNPAARFPDAVALAAAMT